MEIKNTTPFHVLIAVCFVAIVLLCWAGVWYPCLYLTGIIILTYLVLGSVKKGRIDGKFLVFPILSCGLCWLIAFIFAQKYSLMFHDTPPTFTILGLHPSLFWIVIFYWLGPVFTLAGGFYKYKDRWLSDADWQEFKNKLAAIEKEENGGEGK